MSNVLVGCIVGARPNFMKMAPILAELERRPKFKTRLIHTGQHYSPEMSDNFFRDLDLRQPDVNLEVGPGSHAAQTAAIMLGLEPVFENPKPHAVIVVGDVTSTIAAALVAAKIGIRIAHVEAGQRSFDRAMPEEINRLVTDVLSDYLFVSEPSGLVNLAAEGIAPEKICLSGNVMLDTLMRSSEKAKASPILTQLGINPGGYALCTLHRPSNVDDPKHFAGLWGMLNELAGRIPVLFPVHPRTRKQLDGLNPPAPGLVVRGPLGYLDFVKVMSEARLVLTDSGGIQEETTFLNVPCMTLRENTEWPLTVEKGTNRLAGVDSAAILKMALSVLEEPMPEPRSLELWDGRASARIVDFLDARL